MGIDHLAQSRAQGLKREFENLSMKKTEKVSDFTDRFSKIVFELRQLGEKLDDKEVVKKLLRSMPPRYDSLTLSLEQFGDLDSMSLVEAIRSLKVHEMRLSERDAREEEQALLSRALNKFKNSKHEDGQMSRGRGRGRGRDQGRGKSQSSDDQKQEGSRKPFDKSKVQCYNCQDFDHFADECKNEKKPRVREESANLTVEESSLCMAYTEAILLQGAQEVNLRKNMWYLDTRASSHMTSNKSYFHSIDESQQGVIRFSDEFSVRFEGKGYVFLNYFDGEEIKLEGVLLVPSLRVNILSLGKLDEDGFTSTLGGGVLSIFDKEGKQFARIQKTNDSMYLLKLGISEFCQISREEDQEVWLWHHRFCHQNFRAIDDMRKGEMVRGLPNISFSDCLCRNCVVGKHSRSTFPSASPFRAIKRLELIHCDICGPIQPSTIGGRRYYFLLVDDFTRLLWVFFLKEKSEAYHHFKVFKILAESECGEKLKCFRTDRGGEFNSKELGNFYDMNGIKRHLTDPYSPQQNRVVERKNRTIMSCVRSMLKEKKLPLELWAEVVNTCVYVLNRSYTKSLKDATPYEKWSGRKPSVDHLRVFGSVVHVKTTRKVSKLEDRSTLMILIGYECGTKAYRCLDPMNFKVTISRDVIFEESQCWDFSQQRGQRIDLILTSTINLVNSSEVSTDNQDSIITSIVPTDEQRDQSLEEDRPEKFISVQEIYDETQAIEEDEACLFSGEEPTSYKTTMKEEVWRKAMKEELEAIEKNSTWELVKLLEKYKSIGVKWIYKIKRDVSREITRYKA